jgi:Icc-related predicted phosphoesterase
MKRVRVVCISDTHGRHEEVSVPDGDVLIHAGDFTSIGSPLQVKIFNDWLGRLPHKHKIVVAGNHDFMLERYTVEEINKFVLTNAHYLQDSRITVEGLGIYGTPWTPRFRNWAFMCKRGEDMAAKWKLIPKNLDILIVHGPPYGILDIAPGYGHVGCEELFKSIREKKPRVVVFGHIHAGYGKHAEFENTAFFNASICNEQYQPVNAPIVLDVIAQ